MTRFQSVLLVVFIFFADQISKWWIVEQIIKPLVYTDRTQDPVAMAFLPWLVQARKQMPFAMEEILPFFNIVMVWNRGISFGLFNQGDSGHIILSVLAVAVSVVFGIWMMRTSSRMVRLALALIIGGALGNILDRIRFGAVVDFLDLHSGGLHWPAFNLGDSTICLGIAMLLIHSLFFDVKPKQAVKNDQ